MKKYKSIFSIGLIGGLIVALIAVFVIGTAQDKKLVAANIAMAQAQKQKLDKQAEEAKAQKEEQDRQNRIKGVGHTINYVALGDSLTAGWYATGLDKAYVNLVAAGLKDRMGFDVVTTQNAHAGVLLSWGITQVARVNAIKPDLITIELGTNDADSRHLTDIVLFETQLNSLIDKLTEVGYNPAIVLVTTWGTGVSANDYDAVIKKVGQERSIPVADISYIKRDPSSRGPEGIDTHLGKSDIYHPNDQGMKQISEVIYKQAEPLLIKLVDDKKI